MKEEKADYSASVSVTLTVRKMEETGPFLGCPMYAVALAGVFVGCFEDVSPDPWQWVGDTFLDDRSREYEDVVDQINAMMRDKRQSE